MSNVSSSTGSVTYMCIVDKAKVVCTSNCRTQTCQTSPEEYKWQSTSQTAVLEENLATNVLKWGPVIGLYMQGQHAHTTHFFKGYRARKLQNRQLSSNFFIPSD